MKWIFGIVSCLFLFSFSEPEKRYEKFRNWYSENASALQFSVSEGSHHYQLRFLPKEIKVAREIVNKENTDSKEIKLLNEKYDAYYEFHFKISIDHVQDVMMHLSENEEMYNGIQFYLLEDIIRDFTLVTTSGYHKPLRCSFENNYGTAPFLSFHLVFPKDEDDQLKELIYDDMLLSKGEISYDLSAINELKIPKIK